jgi:hypothetical protein
LDRRPETMEWLGFRRQDVLNSVSRVLSQAEAHAQSRSWNIRQLDLKSFLQATLLATSPLQERPHDLFRSCPNAQLSCHNISVADTCCLNYPGGQLLQTQFWDTSPAVGPQDSWTIHGLWFVVHSRFEHESILSDARKGLISATGPMKHIAINQGDIPTSVLFLLPEAAQMFCPICSSTGRTTKVTIRASGPMNGRSMEPV